MPVIQLDNFAGGANYGDPEKIGPSEAGTLQSWIHTDGNLRSFDGQTVHSLGLSSGIRTSYGVRALYRFYSGSSRYFIAVGGGFIFLYTGDATNSWRPIYYMGASTQTKDVSFAPWGIRLYISVYDARMVRWDAFYYTTGTIKPNGTTTVPGTSTLWQTGAVRKGDTLFVQIGSSWYGPYYITAIGSETSLTTSAAVQTAAGVASDYIIARTHEAGILTPTGTITATAVGSGGSLTAGDYKFAVTYANSLTGFESDPVYISGTVVCVASDSVTIAGYGTGPTGSGLQADTFNVYRTKAFGAKYYLAESLTRDQTGYTFATTATVDGADSALGAELEIGHTPPPYVRRIYQWNNRLYGYGLTQLHRTGDTYATTGADVNQLCLSKLNCPEYWQRNQWDADDPFDIDVLAGAFISVGQPGIEIRGLLGDGGAAAAGDTRGSSLLVLKESGLSYRWYGMDWSDFELDEAFETTCPSSYTAASREGKLFWCSRKGPVGIETGSNQVIPLYQKLFPEASRDFEALNTAASLAGLRACVWRDWYILAWRETASTTNNRCALLHIPSGSCTTLDHSSNSLGARAFSVWMGPGDAGELYYALDSTAVSINRLWAKTSSNTFWVPSTSTGVAHSYVTPMFYGAPEELRKIKHLKQVWLCFQRPAADQTITLTPLIDGATTGTAQSQTLATAGSVGRKWLRFACAEHGSAFQIQITGTFTVPVVLERIEIEYDVHGDVTA